MTFDQWYLEATGIPVEQAQTRLLRECWDAATEAERERCAKIAEDDDTDPGSAAVALGIADKIRQP